MKKTLDVAEPQAFVAVTWTQWLPTKLMTPVAGSIVAKSSISPAADTPRPKGSAVTVVVSTGPATGTIPSVECLTEANAINTIENAGFTANVTEQDTTDPSEVGRVISQDPPGNSNAELGSTVTIVVGRVTPGDPPDTLHC